MKRKAILFDLDGTLLPQDQDIFVKAYFKLLAAKMAPRGYAPDALIKAIWHGTEAMIKNNGKKTNEEVFWDDFSAIFGEKARQEKEHLDDFYAHEFFGTRESCAFNPLVPQVIARLKETGYRLILATNPIFPLIAVESRLQWAGLSPDDFEYITSYENAHYTKPTPAYYQEILENTGLLPQDCLMVGNDVRDDGAAGKLGIPVFFLTDCLINQEKRDLEDSPHGDFVALMEYLDGEGNKAND